jgi:glucokinase
LNVEIRENTVSHYAVGVDFGGTNIKAGVCDQEGQLLSFIISPTLRHEGEAAVIHRIVNAIQRAIEESKLSLDHIASVAIGACGLVDPDRGYFVSSSVMPGWHDVPLSKSITAAIGLPVILENDANAAIFGEWWAGVARHTKHTVGMTLGTGIGGGAILDGRLFRGCSNQAGEFGHLTVDPDGPQCYCGNYGCLGLLASAHGLVQRFVAQIHKGRYSVLIKQVDLYAEVGSLTAQQIYEAAMSGDELAYEIITETGRYLGIGVASLLSCFNPEMVVLTGGLTGMGDSLLAIIRAEAKRRTYPALSEAARIEFGVLGDKAGVIGAVGIWQSL